MSVLKGLDIDQVSQHILPPEHKYLIPLKTSGDGNCLYRAISILCCGSETLHSELRVRTVCEMTLNEDFYLQPSTICLLDVPSAGKQTPVLPATSSKFNEACNSYSCNDTERMNVARIVYQLECLSTPRNGEWSSMWHVHALASVLMKPNISVYPDTNQRIRSVFNKKIIPRLEAQPQEIDALPVVVMWTHTCNKVCGTTWSPNHFVPCYANNDFRTKCTQTSLALLRSTLRPPTYSMVSSCSGINFSASNSPTALDLSQSVHNTSTGNGDSINTSVDVSQRTHTEAYHIDSAVCTSVVLSNSAYVSVVPQISAKSTSEITAPPLSTSNSVSTPCELAHLAETSICTTDIARILQNKHRERKRPKTSLSTPLSHYFKKAKVATVQPVSSISKITPISTDLSLSKTTVMSQLSKQRPPTDVVQSPAHDTTTPKCCSSESSIRTVKLAEIFATPSRKQVKPSLSCQSLSIFFQTRPRSEVIIPSKPGSFISTPTSKSSMSQVATQSKSEFIQQTSSNLHLTGINESFSADQTSNIISISTSSMNNSTKETSTKLSANDIDTRIPLATTKSSSQTLSEDTFTGHDETLLRDMVTSTPSTISPSTFFNILSSSGHYRHKSKVQSKKITDFVESSALVKPAANDSDDSLDEYEFSYFHDEVSGSESSGRLSTSSISDESESDIEIQYYPEYSSSLPFPEVSTGWYEKQYSLSIHNAAREEHRQRSITCLDERSNMQFINRSQVNDTLETNISLLLVKLNSLQHGPTRSHLQAIVAVGKYIIANGPLVATQVAGQCYMKEKSLSEKKYSMEFYEIFSKHLNLAQVYIFHKAYLIENSKNLSAIFNFISSAVNHNSESLVKQTINDKIKQFLPTSLKYMDSHRDRRVVKALIAEVTSIRFASQVQGIQSKKGTTNATKSFKSDLIHYQHVRMTSQVVRNDLTNVQQYKLTERIISQRKLQEIKTIASGRGRKLKCENFPELATALLYEFGEIDAIAGGSLEAHPRLTNGTLYRSCGSTMTMKRAREILLSLASEDFTISLSACYNYTENFRAGSSQAKRHHAGKGVNAQLLLRKPPRIGVEQIVINLHWSTANVNLQLDSTQGLSRSLQISKDAKAIVPGDIPPVQRPGHSWNSRLEFPDHSWDQSRTNAVTPMTFLFLQTKVSPSNSLQNLSIQASENTMLQLTRTGQSVTLVNLSFYEADTTFRCLNEICYLLTISELDPFFRDNSSGKLKEFVFVVDNGPAEQPSSPLVKMCLARLLRFLKLDKICQMSYHSKRNFVERAR